MKLFTTILFTFAVAGTYTATAQTSTYNTTISLGQDSLYNADYFKLKQLYIKKLDSETHYKCLVLGERFVAKINHPAKRDALRYIYKDPLKYIKENLSTTSFESYDAAVEEWEALTIAQMQDWEANREFYKLEDVVRKRWGSKILSDVADEIDRESPEKFNLLEKPRKPE